MTTSQDRDEREGLPSVVLCGSMSALGLMHELAAALRIAGVEAVVPDADEDWGCWSLEGAAQVKREASRRHIDRIRSSRTAAVLVTNVDRAGRPDYVGPNAFAEAAIAFADDRPVFLLQGMPDLYADELRAWGVQCLHGDLSPLLEQVGGPDRHDELDECLDQILVGTVVRPVWTDGASSRARDESPASSG